MYGTLQSSQSRNYVFECPNLTQEISKIRFKYIRVLILSIPIMMTLRHAQLSLSSLWCRIGVTET